MSTAQLPPLRHWIEEWHDEYGTHRTCSNYWRTIYDNEESHAYGTCEEPGRCGGCGRYGKFGTPCFRKLDGVMEECGEFV